MPNDAFPRRSLKPYSEIWPAIGEGIHPDRAGAWSPLQTGDVRTLVVHQYRRS